MARRSRLSPSSTVADVKWLDAEAIVAIHEDLLERWGGAPGGGHRGSSYEGVEAATQAVKNSYYETVEELAAAYAVYIVQGHVFMDGNKRSGAAVLATFMHGNDQPPKISWRDLFGAMVDLQKRSEDGEDTNRLIAWLAAKL